MTTHPSLQPVLRQSNVTTLINRVSQQVPPFDATPEYRAGFNDAREQFKEITAMMWQATVIATEAQNTDIMRREEERLAAEDGTAANDTLDNLAGIAGDLLALAERLDNVEEG